jgi:hypothetical protein
MAAPPLYVATRKGLFVFHSGADGWALTEHVFPGDPVVQVLHDPRDGSVYAALDLGHYGPKLHVLRAGASAWEELATPAMPESTDSAVKLLWELTAGGEQAPGRLWCGTTPGGLFRSDDFGASWTLVQTLWDDPQRPEWFGGGFDHPGIHSIVIDTRDAEHVQIGVSCGGVWESFDGGETWANYSQGMRAEYMPEGQEFDTVSQDPHCLRSCHAQPDREWVQHHNGIFVRDAPGPWREIAKAGPSTCGFPVAAPPTDPDTAWFVPAVKDDCRIPADARVVVTRTRDGGASFEVLSNGLPQQHAFDLVFRHALDVDGSGDRLAFGSTTGSLWLSEDGGDHWSTLSHHLPPIYSVRFAR